MKREVAPSVARPGARLLVALASLLLAACGDKMDPLQHDLDASLEVSGPVTYEAHIKPLLDSNCVRCHATDRQGEARRGAPADVNLDSYAGAFEAAERANVMLQGGSMPPNSGGLPSRDRALFRQWLEDGRLER